jgi:hypothetical protein
MWQDLWCLIISDKMRVGATISRAVEVSVLLSFGEHFLQNWLGQGTFLDPDEPTDLYIGYYSL